MRLSFLFELNRNAIAAQTFVFETREPEATGHHPATSCPPPRITAPNQEISNEKSCVVTSPFMQRKRKEIDSRQREKNAGTRR
jgi:hypothetical protein